MSTSRDPVPFDAPAVERGVGFFETLLLVGRRAVLFEPHIARLLGTLAHFELPAPSRVLLESSARAAVDEARVGPGGERGLRLAWLAVAADLDDPRSWRLDAVVRPIPATTLARRNGSHAVTLPAELRRDSPGAKSTSYFGAIAGLRLARRRGGDEGLFCDTEGRYAEGTSTGLVAWNGGDLLTPDRAALPSVTTAAFLGGRGRAAPVTAREVRAGALLLGSLTTAVPVLSLDGAPCETPEAMLREAREFSERLVSRASSGREL